MAERGRPLARLPRSRIFVGALALVALAALATVVALSGGGGGGPKSDGGRSPGSTSTRRPGPLADVRALDRIAREHGGTRAAGTRGYAASVRYVVARLRAAGWRVRMQPVPFVLFRERRPARLELDGRPVAEVAALRYSGSGTASGRALAIGGGCSAAERARIVKGSVAVVRQGGCLARGKVLAAQRRGAVAVVVSEPRLTHPLPATLLGPGVRIPAVAVAGRAARTLKSGRARVRVSVDASSSRGTTTNVLAELPRGDPGAVVMAGAHLDSVPEGPGVNDNGSGGAALLAIARRLGRRGEGLRRRVRLAFWGAEELGLVGSRRYVRSLGPAERTRIRAYLNLDMVGSKGGRRLLYGGAGLPQAVRAARAAVPGLRRIPEASAASDELSFGAAGIATIGLFSGLDPCYHRACDTLANVDPRELRALTRGAAAVILALAR